MARSVDQMILEMVVENQKAIKGLTQVQKKGQQISKESEGFFKRMKKGWLIFAGVLTGVVVGGFTKLIGAASRAQETLSKFNTVFRDVKKEADATAKNLARNFGLSAMAARQLLSDTGDLLSGFGFTQKSALDLSKQVNELAVDLASFTNFSGGAEGASQALTKALLGERESVKALGISILETDVKAKVLENTQKGLTFETERQAKAYATLMIAQEQSKNAIGDFARTSEGFANQIRILRANFENWAVAAGEKLLPVLGPIVSVLNRILTPAKDIEDVTQDLIKSQTEYREVVRKLKDEQNKLSEAEKVNLKIRKDVLELDIITQIDELNKKYGDQVVTIEKLTAVDNRRKEALKSLGDKLTSTKKKTVELTEAEARLIGETTRLNVMGKEVIVTTFNRENAERKWTEAQRRSKEATVERNEEEQKLLTTVSLIASALVNKSITEEQLIGLDSQLLELIRERVPLIEAEIEAEGRREGKRKEHHQWELDRIDKKADKEDKARKKKEAEEEKARKRADKLIKDKEKADKQRRAMELEATKSALSDITSLTGSSNRTLFEIGKQASLAIATMNVAQAITKTMTSVPFPFNIPLAIAQGIAGAIQVSKIANQTLPAAAEGMDSAPGGPVLVGEKGPEVVNLPMGSEVIPNNKINMSRFHTIPAFANGGVVGGDTIDSSNTIIIENMQMAPETPEDFQEKLMEFSESINTDMINP
jgi:hypothetical protein